jgi:hypothetical protein
MAVWRMLVAGNEVTLVYETAGKPPEECGRAELPLRDSLEQWVCDEAQVWDCIVTPHGSFVRQVTTVAGARA